MALAMYCKLYGLLAAGPSGCEHGDHVIYSEAVYYGLLCKVLTLLPHSVHWPTSLDPRQGAVAAQYNNFTCGT